MAETINFDAEAVGVLPKGWSAGVTGRGSARWTVEADASAPSKPNVLKQTGQGDFPWCVLRDASLTDGFVEVRFKPLSGKQDQAGGIVWRWKDGNNYYVARANALENNVSLYYTVPGDLNTDGKVDLLDLQLLSRDWLKQGSGLSSDLNGSGKVDFDDFGALGENWSSGN